LPVLFPTHVHSPLFWEQLGRTIATFGYLEKVLKKAIFTFTATRTYDAHEMEKQLEQWQKKLGSTLGGQLSNLATDYRAAIKGNQNSTVQDVDELVEKISQANKTRNILCHASWGVPDAEGKSVPFFLTKNFEVCETPMDVQYLRQVQEHVANLACDVIDTVTQMGWQFPGVSSL
jgi:hypothetical protein